MDGVAPDALEFTLLTAARTGEVLEARWQEVELKTRLWTIPASRTKAGREHRVPLSDRALEILRGLADARASEFVFPGLKRNRPLSSIAMQAVMRRMNVDATVHGFRSAFRDWTGESTQFPREVAEAARAHQMDDSVERAWARG